MVRRVRWVGGDRRTRNEQNERNETADTDSVLRETRVSTETLKGHAMPAAAE